MVDIRISSELAKDIAEAFVASDPSFQWEFADIRFISAEAAGDLVENANQWVVEFKAAQGEWNHATKLVGVDGQTGECVDWGC